MEKDEVIMVRLPMKIKDKFKEVCKQDLTDVSTKIRQFILKEIKKKKLK